MVCSSNKMSYWTRGAAKRVARSLKSCGDARRPVRGRLRPYLCRECGTWHLATVGRR